MKNRLKSSRHVTLTLVLLFTLSLIALAIYHYPVLRYWYALLTPDLYGYPDCDTLNDWLTEIAPMYQALAYDVATGICLLYP